MNVVARYMAEGELVWCRILPEDKAIILQELIICEFGENGDFVLEIEDLDSVSDQGDWQEYGTTGATLRHTPESYAWFRKFGFGISENMDLFDLYDETDPYEVVCGFFVTFIRLEDYVPSYTPAQCGYSVEVDDEGNEVGGPLTWEDIAP